MIAQGWNPSPALPAMDATASAEARALRMLAVVLGGATASDCPHHRRESPQAPRAPGIGDGNTAAGMFTAA